MYNEGKKTALILPPYGTEQWYLPIWLTYPIDSDISFYLHIYNGLKGKICVWCIHSQLTYKHTKTIQNMETNTKKYTKWIAVFTSTSKIFIQWSSLNSSKFTQKFAWNKIHTTINSFYCTTHSHARSLVACTFAGWLHAAP